MSPSLAYSADQTTPPSDLARQQICRPVRIWTDGAAGVVGPATVNFITASDAARLKAADDRRVRRQKTRVVAKMEAEAREPLIRDRVDDLLASGFAASRQEAWHVAKREVVKAEIETEARRRLPQATPMGIQRRVAKEMDIRAAVRDRSEAVRDRLENGYQWNGGEDPATGRERPAFVYQGLKSDEHPHLKLFSSCLPKSRPSAKDADEGELRQALKVGTKEFTRAVGSKLLGLDETYADGQKSVRGFIRIDCDGSFASWDSCRLALIDALDGPDLLPHIVVGDELSDGRILRPHFIWLLPEKSRVRFDTKALLGPQALFHAIARALTAATIPVGADVGGLSNLMRVKNPLCPHWSTAVMNARDPLALGDLAVRLERWMTSDTATMAERQVAVHSAAFGISECQSNTFFRETTTVCWALARQWLADGDKRGELRGDELVEAFVAALGHDARHALPAVPPRRAMAMLGSVCQWAARRFDPTVRRQPANPGALRGRLGGLDLHSRQVAGGRHSAATRRDASVVAIRAAVAALHAEGVEITKAAVAEHSGVSYRTVLRLYDAAIAVGEETPATSGKTRVTDGLRKIAGSEAGGAGQVHCHHSASRKGATRPSRGAFLRPFRLPHRRPSVERDGEYDDDVVALLSHETWLAADARTGGEPPAWLVDRWLAEAA